MNELHLLGSYKKIISEKEFGILIRPFPAFNDLRKIRLTLGEKSMKNEDIFSLFSERFPRFRYNLEKNVARVLIDEFCRSRVEKQLNFLHYSRRASQVHWISRSTTTKLHMPFTCGVTIARHARARFSVRLLKCYILLADVIRGSRDLCSNFLTNGMTMLLFSTTFPGCRVA